MQNMNARSPSDPKAPSLRTRLREATAAAILDAAEEVFAAEGLHAAHMNDIATKAGVAVGTLYNHFKDRDALLAALLTDRRQGMLDVMDEFMAQPPGADFEADLLEMMSRVGAYLDQNRRFHSLLHQLDGNTGLANYPETSACAPELKRRMHERLGRIMERGVAQKALRPELASMYPTLLMGILRSARQHEKEAGVIEHEGLNAAQIVHFFMHGASVKP